MTYQVLARKWRPRTFAELSGQEPVVRALTNALDRGRLHHAYLLTGTRGVGKTTIARILAKSLNCASGVSATPCGTCAACTDIDAGRFVDLLELDAASNTGIDNMREILDNARYAPTVGRYKVYLIDEVHMLSKAAFNSMLKTLEEPPEHVKFVLATTDPQKIPVTVLSRCLQFALRQIPAATIVERLGVILAAESIAADPGALALVARAAQGSMRDALSLLDQAIAYGAGEVREDVVRSMLGAVDGQHAYRLAEALLANDGVALLAEADAMNARSIAATSALEELAALFHRVAVLQVVPDAGATWEDRERLQDFAQRMTPEQVQLAYQICVQGRADLALAPDETIGFGMTLLRLLAFEPGSSTPGEGTLPAPAVGVRGAGPALAAGRAAAPAAPSARQAAAPVVPELACEMDSGGIAAVRAARPAAPIPQETPTVLAPTLAPQPPVAAEAASPLPARAEDWIALVPTLRLSGMAGQLAAQSEWRRGDGNEIVLALPEAQRHLTDRAYADKLRAAIEARTRCKVRFVFEFTPEAEASLAAQERRERAEQKARTEAAFRDEPFVRDVLTRFEARIKPDSIRSDPIEADTLRSDSGAAPSAPQ